MKKMSLIWIAILITIITQVAFTQQVEVQGELKVTEMNADNTEDNLVTRKTDGTLGTRSVASLPPPSPPIDSTRNLASDFVLAKHLCDCPNLPPFLIENLLSSGYTAADLIGAGVPAEDVNPFIPILDGDGNEYSEVTIGTQVWLGENLKTTTYNDGSSIPYMVSNANWGNSDNTNTPAYCWPDGNASNKDDYGALYNWWVTSSSDNGNKNVCPNFWHIPTQAELSTLREIIDPGSTSNSNVAGGYLKEVGNDHWVSPNVGATDDYGFGARGSGYRLPSGSFSQFQENLMLQSQSTASNNSVGSALWANTANYNSFWNIDKGHGKSIRCIKD